MLELVMAPPADTFGIPEGLRLLFTGLLSAPVLVGAGAGGLKLWQARKDRRVTERKDVRDEDNDLVQHWKQAAENAQRTGAEMVKSAQEESDRRVSAERASKESAIRTVRELLDLQELQNTALRDTITRLTAAIEQLTAAGGAASSLVVSLREERDEMQRKLQAAMDRVARLTAQLMDRQRDLLGADTPDTAELAALDEDLQRRADTGPTTIQEVAR